MKILSLAILFAILAWVASLNFAHAQQTIYVEPSPFWSSYYAASNGFNESYNITANARARGAMVNAYREAHGLPKCSAFPIFHWDGLPGC
jgi:hypothetical protein